MRLQIANSDVYERDWWDDDSLPDQLDSAVVHSQAGVQGELCRRYGHNAWIGSRLKNH